MTQPHGATVTYSVTEMLARQDKVLDQISEKLDAKASRADLVALSQRIDGHDDSIAVLEEDKRNRDRWKRTTAWLVMIAATCASAVVAALHVHF